MLSGGEGAVVVKEGVPSRSCAEVSFSCSCFFSLES
jgi:hypothetical protein